MNDQIRILRGLTQLGYKEKIKSSTEVLQYIKTLMTTCNNYDPDNDDEIQAWNDNMLSVQGWLFGLDPIEGFNEEIYINDFEIETLIKDEFTGILRCINVLSYHYNGPRIANILYNVLLKKGVVGRAAMHVPMFSQTINKEVKWWSISDMLNKGVQVGEPITFRNGVYWTDFWVELNNEIHKECEQMRLLSSHYRDTYELHNITPMNVMYVDAGIFMVITRI